MDRCRCMVRGVSLDVTGDMEEDEEFLVVHEMASVDNDTCFFASKQGFAYMLGPPRHSSASWYIVSRC
eukprot:746135-Hanusia_phi.AAC.3